ncbi:MAG TPA: multifunctional CCA tRNA nucleotidyl transferase/2'3'-cyclic phosphodiesterase/2'nucleotidase/phosphatase, partial [Rheinheimera sp.]|nr:multifunctional CCA tRNA nucleotidyl transferase/2'3'-cyclic phosphodiesterase/2'nucleotidase/phosphatase [Rheinheimera sp.]
DLWRKPQRLEAILLCCEADLRGRTGFEKAAYPQAEYLRQLASAALQVNAKTLLAQGLQGEQIKQGLERARLDAISTAKAHDKTDTAP